MASSPSGLKQAESTTSPEAMQRKHLSILIIVLLETPSRSSFMPSCDAVAAALVLLLVDLTTLHDKSHVLEFAYILERIARYRDDVSVHTGFERTDIGRPVQ